MAEFKDSPTVLVGDADCTAEGESLCQQMGVRGYPTIKYGDPNDLQDFEGGRSFDDLLAFAKENLGPQCSPSNLDLCDDEKKALIAKFSAMSSEQLDAVIKVGADTLEKLEADFKEFVAGLDAQMEKVSPDEKEALMKRLREQYGKETAKKDAATAVVKASGVGLAKTVKASAASKKSEL